MRPLGSVWSWLRRPSVSIAASTTGSDSVEDRSRISWAGDVHSVPQLDEPPPPVDSTPEAEGIQDGVNGDVDSLEPGSAFANGQSMEDDEGSDVWTEDGSGTDLEIDKASDVHSVSTDDVYSDGSVGLDVDGGSPEAKPTQESSPPYGSIPSVHIDVDEEPEVGVDTLGSVQGEGSNLESKWEAIAQVLLSLAILLSARTATFVSPFGQLWKARRLGNSRIPIRRIMEVGSVALNLVSGPLNFCLDTLMDARSCVSRRKSFRGMQIAGCLLLGMFFFVCLVGFFGNASWTIILGNVIFGLVGGVFDTVATTNIKQWTPENMDWMAVFIKQAVRPLDWLLGSVYRKLERYFGMLVTVFFAAAISILASVIPNINIKFNRARLEQPHTTEEVDEERRLLIPMTISQTMSAPPNCTYKLLVWICVACFGSGVSFAFDQFPGKIAGLITGTTHNHGNISAVVQVLVAVLGNLIARLGKYLSFRRHGTFSNGSCNLLALLYICQVIGILFLYFPWIDPLYIQVFIRVATNAQSETIQAILKQSFRSLECCLLFRILPAIALITGNSVSCIAFYSDSINQLPAISVNTFSSLGSLVGIVSAFCISKSSDRLRMCV